MEQIVLGCITTLKINTIVSQLQSIENQEVPFLGPLDLVVIIDKRIVPVKKGIKINIYSLEALDKMHINYKYIKNKEIQEISKIDLLPIDQIGNLIIVPEEKEVDMDPIEDEFDGIHKMLEEYNKDLINTTSSNQISSESDNMTMPESNYEDIDLEELEWDTNGYDETVEELPQSTPKLQKEGELEF